MSKPNTLTISTIAEAVAYGQANESRSHRDTFAVVAAYAVAYDMLTATGMGGADAKKELASLAYGSATIRDLNGGQRRNLTVATQIAGSGLFVAQTKTFGPDKGGLVLALVTALIEGHGSIDGFAEDRKAGAKAGEGAPKATAKDKVLKAQADLTDDDLKQVAIAALMRCAARGLDLDDITTEAKAKVEVYKQEAEKMDRAQDSLVAKAGGVAKAQAEAFAKALAGKGGSIAA